MATRSTSHKKKIDRDPFDCRGRLRWWSSGDDEDLPIPPQQAAARAEAETVAQKIASHPPSTRSLYWYWLPRVGPQTALRLAMVAYSDQHGYNALKRELGQMGRVSA